MEPLTVIFGLSVLALSGGMGWWLVRNEKRTDSLLESITLLQESQGATQAHVASRVEDLEQSLNQLNSAAQALMAANPDMSGIIKAHTASSEEERISALETILSTIPEGSRYTDELLSAGQLSTCVELLSSSEITLSSPITNLRAGLVALQSGLLEQARVLLESAATNLPGDDIALEALERCCIISGDSNSRKHWLEQRLQINPDDPELLRTHAHILASMGDESAERNVKRLEALGLDTAADRSLLAELRSRAGSRSEALEAIENALEEDPTRSADWCKRAEILLGLDEPRKALESVERCLGLDRQNGEAWAIKAQILSQDESSAKDALKAATHAVALDAGGVDLIMLKADLLAFDGRQVDAQESLDKAIEKAPQNGELRSRLADRHLLAGEADLAESLLLSTPVHVEHPMLHVVEGRITLYRSDRARDGTGQTDRQLLSDACTAFESALELDRESGIAWLGLARVQRLLGSTDIAKESLTRARRLLPDEDPGALAESAMLALDSGDLESAQQFIDGASIRGEGALIPYIRGNIAAARGRIKEALSHYDESISLESGHIRARLNRASVKMALDDHPSALADCDRLLEDSPNLLLARLRRAEALMGLTSWSEAREELLTVTTASPHHHHALTLLASCQMALGRPENAETPLNEALRHEPSFAPAWHQRGLLYLDWGREDAALSDFEAAIRCDGNHMDSRLHVAAIHHGAGRTDEALASWRAILAIDPENQVAKKRAEECESALIGS